MWLQYTHLSKLTDRHSVLYRLEKTGHWNVITVFGITCSHCIHNCLSDKYALQKTFPNHMHDQHNFETKDF